jgi:hypothetical protein
MSILIQMLADPSSRLPDLTEHINKLTPEERLRQVMALGKREQRRLWDLAEKSHPLSLSYLVPPEAKPLEFFSFAGKNSLPFFRRFHKVFYLDHDRNVCGYNAHPNLVQWTIGHGYFMVQMNPRAMEHEIQIDYTRVPSERPPGWPEIHSNDVFPTRFVYGGTKDNLRWVSEDVLIGRAFKQGTTPMPNWFVLCRVPLSKEGKEA